MACPKCGCKVHYQYCDDDFGPDDERLERCAACGEVFDIEDSPDEDEEPLFIQKRAGERCNKCGPFDSICSRYSYCPCYRVPLVAQVVSATREGGA
jgi:hypothetical protein